jgi:hypothetical protein
MFEEEENLKNGRILSDTQILEQILRDGNGKPTRRQGNIFLKPS